MDADGACLASDDDLQPVELVLLYEDVFELSRDYVDDHCAGPLAVGVDIES